MKRLLFAFCFTIFIGTACAQEYTIETGREGISCILATATQSNMMELLGNMSSCNWDIERQFANFCLDLSKRYMVVVVAVKNSTSEKIFLSKDRYFDFGIHKNILIPKEKLSELYEPILDNGRIQFGTGKFIMYTALVFALLPLIAMYYLPAMPIFVLGGFVTAMFGAVGLFGRWYKNEYQCFYDNIAVARDNFMSLVSLNSHDKTCCIKPGEEFCDLFLVDLALYNRDIFSRVMPKLKLCENKLLSAGEGA